MLDKSDQLLNRPDVYLLKAGQVATVLGVRSKTVLSRSHKGSIRATPIYGHYYISVGEVKRYLKVHAPKEK